MPRISVPLFALAALVGMAIEPAAAFDASKVGSPNYNRLGVDRLTIQGSGSTGDVSSMSVIPSLGAAGGTLARQMADRPVLSTLPSCTPGSEIAPVPTGQLFQCSGLILIAQ